MCIMAVRGQVDTENICMCMSAHSQQCQRENSGDVTILWLNMKRHLKLALKPLTITPQEHVINTLKREIKNLS